ncbi:MAG: hypothetical protein JXQ87_10975 [Bacteroidia bacterium]
MIRKLLLFTALPFLGFIAACGGDDDTPIDDGNNGNNEPTSVDEIGAIIGGDGQDSVVWVGKEWWQAAWMRTEQKFDDFQEVTNDADYRFTEHEIWFKYDDYNTERFGYPVGKGRWTDPYGKSGFYYEMDNGNMDTLFLNRGESYPPSGGRQDWVMEKITKEELIFVREWYYGNALKKERFIWMKK